MKLKKEIFAAYDKKYIRIYQAYNKQIATEAVILKTFGESYNTNRMTWIKPSFLWMMERSNWGKKKNQEYILAIDILREGFDYYLENAVLTSNESTIYKVPKEWEDEFKKTNIYCQWDPDRDIYGNAINRMAIQIGIKNTALRDYLDKYINDITDITKSVTKWRDQIKTGKLKKNSLPRESIYPVSDEIKKRLGMY